MKRLRVVSLDTRFGKRRTVNMNEDIAQELVRLANMEGKTLYSLINELGLFALEAHRLGYSPREAAKARVVEDRAKKSRMMLVNQDLWYTASSEASRGVKKKWTKAITENAKWQADVFLNKASEEEFLQSLRDYASDFLWDCSEFLLEKRKGDEFFLKAVFVPEMPLEHTSVVFKALEVMFNSGGYVITDSAVRAGFLTATFKRVSG